MTKVEFIKLIDEGSDIMFDVGEKHFTIITWSPNGIGIGEQYPNESKIVYYKSATDLVNKFKINSFTLAEVLEKIVITQYT